LLASNGVMCTLCLHIHSTCAPCSSGGGALSSCCGSMSLHTPVTKSHGMPYRVYANTIQLQATGSLGSRIDENAAKCDKVM